MPKINILPKDIAELIAAGEVIERPASVIKELVENSIDAGAKKITVEIKNGGITYMRVTDDGCGIAPEDVPCAFLRHATSKISGKSDLDSIMTLGFRGEALASVSAVSRVELLTKRREDAQGTHFTVEGASKPQSESIGCPDGTTIIIRDIFFNVPARQKFLKKDITEANAVTAVVHKQILSHPEVSVRIIKNNKQEICSAGDGELLSAIYSVYGRSFAGELIPVAPYHSDGLSVSGFVVKPLNAKGSRSFQSFFINGRYVRSLTCQAAIDEAYKNLIMVGKFPACVINLTVPPDTVDVNVHPAKAEVRFSDERIIFNAVYFAVKNALMSNGSVYGLDIEKVKKSIDITPASAAESFTQTSLPLMSPATGTACRADASFAPAWASANEAADSVRSDESTLPSDLPPNENAVTAEYAKSLTFVQKCKPVLDVCEDEREMREQLGQSGEERQYKFIAADSFEKTEIPAPAPNPEPIQITVIGEVFKNYILAQAGNELVIIDKHAAHERIIFEKLKSRQDNAGSQLVLESNGVMLGEDEILALVENEDIVASLGFELDYSQSPLVFPKKIPMLLDYRDMDEIVPQIARKLMSNSTQAAPDIIDDLLHTMACKSAMKQGDDNDIRELERIACEVWNNPAIRHCPHGRPVMFSLAKSKIEHQFGRS